MIIPIMFYSEESRSGKNFSANYLQNTLHNWRLENVGDKKHRLKVQTFAIADKLKEITASLFNLYGVQSKQYYEDHPLDRKHVLGFPHRRIDVVDLWIEFGEYLKSFDKDIWIKQTIRQIKNSFNSPANVEIPVNLALITDWRFENESQVLKEVYPNTLLVKIVRTDGQSVKRYSDGLVNTTFDYELENDGTKNYFEKLDQFITFLLQYIMQVLAPLKTEILNE